MCPTHRPLLLPESRCCRLGSWKCFAHRYERPHWPLKGDILKSQIAPENTKNAAYTRKPYSMAAQIERPNRAARSDGPIERPQWSGLIGRPQPSTTPTERPNRTNPTERPRSSGQIERSNRTSTTERPDRTAPNRTSPIEQPQSSGQIQIAHLRPRAGRRSRPQNTTAQLIHSTALRWKSLKSARMRMCLSQR